MLVVALGTNAGISILIGTYLAGSLERRNLIWAGCLVAMGAITAALLLAMSVTSSLDTPRAGLGFNPLRIVKRAWETADYFPVIEGFLVGTGLPIAIGFATWLMGRRLGWHFGPVVTLFMALILSGLFVGAKSVQPTVEARWTASTANQLIPWAVYIYRLGYPHTYPGYANKPWDS